MRVVKFAGVLLVLGLFLGPIGRWPWDHDEVHTLVEIGLIPMGEYPGPQAQLERMHRLIPLWTMAQRAALSVLPVNEWGARVLPASCGALVVLVAFAAGRRWRGPWFGWSLAILLATSQALLWLSHQDRFYPFALLWLTLHLILVHARRPARWIDIAAVLSAVAAVLSHNLTLVIVGSTALAAGATWAIGSTSFAVFRRSAVSTVVVAAIYLFYLKPILSGWMSGTTGGTAPLVSFVAQVGILPLALSAYGCVAGARDRALHVWMALLVIAIVFVTCSVQIMGNWNPRYGLFFMIPVWVMAAAGVSEIAGAMRSTTLGLAWLAAVVLMAGPKLASHFIDGSRHDFRTAAAVVVRAPAHGMVVSNWPATLQYYLTPATGEKPTYWAPGERLPAEEAVVVLASNAWEPVLQIPGRRVDVLAEIGKRRFDEQSHLIRVYRVHAD